MRGRRRLVLVLVALTAVLVAGLAAIALAAAGSNQREAAQLLRLTDLPLGYVTNELEEDRGKVAECRPLTEPGDAPSQMLRFVHRFHPHGCIFGFTFSYGEPEARRNPLLVGTGVLDARSAAEANAGWKVVPEMLGRLLGANPPQRTKAPAKVGSATRLFHARTAIIGIGAKAPISFLVWRSGKTLAAVMTAGRPFAIDDAAALLLARHQQARMAKPTPLTIADNYDAEVALENPALDLPVYWLGRHFATGGPVADASLYSSWFVAKPTPERQEESGSFEGPLPKLRLTYSNPVNLTLSTWGPQDWPVYTRSRTAKALVTWKCTQTRTVEVPGGTATIYLGYDQDYAKCPSRKPRSVTAWVKFGEEMVVVDAPFAADSVEPDSPWGSFGAMETVVKGLRLRTPRPAEQPGHPAEPGRT